jgi:predicted ATPase/DNA-binding SARP family transcriptional activator
MVSASELIDAVWGYDLPTDETNALQTLVSRLRRALGDTNLVQQGPGGYRLTGIELDADRFTGLVRQGRLAVNASDAVLAAELFRQALELWRGSALADAADAEYARIAGNRWEELRLDALAERIEADLALGRAAELVAELDVLAREFPLRERFTGQLMSALAATGRHAEALAAFERLRSHLADELGSDPGPDLRRAHMELLRATAGSSEEAGGSGRSPRRTNLRAALTSFLGRDDEVKRISTLLESGRLTTVVGPGGAGKTRLAGVVAADWTDRLSDGVWFVELAPVTDVTNIGQAILGSLGVRSNQVIDRPADLHRMATIDRLIDVLADSDCLLVIDNCEHLISAVATLIDDLLARCPDLRVLATSREPLGIDGEALCLLAPLTLPLPEATAVEALEFPSVQLFADRAAAVSAEFAVDETSVGSVIEIVRRLDGLPLAIELAAARLRVLPVAEIAARLSDRFRLLTGGSRAAMPRHRTLRAVVEWSWDLLTAAERLLAERLSIFPSGATVKSAVVICSDESLPADEIADLLNALVDKSLLQVDDAAPVRYRMLETIREYGAEQLSERDEVGQVRLAHAHYFAALVADAEPWLRSAEQLTWLRLLDLDRDNILAALRYLGESGLADATVRMATSLGWYWTLLGSHSEAATWLSFALEVAGEVQPQARVMAEAIHALNLMATTFGDGPEDEIASSLERLDDIGARLRAVDPTDEPMVLLMRPMMAFFAGDAERITELLDDALAGEDQWVRATSLMFRANLRENLGDVAAMRADAIAAHALFTTIGDRWGLASTLSTIAQVHTMDGDLEAAITAYGQATGYLSEFGATADEAMMHLRLTDLHLRRSDLAAAKREADLVRTTDFQAGTRAQRLLADTAFSAIAVVERDAESMELYRRSLGEQLDLLNPVHPINGHVRAVTLSTLASLELEAGNLPEAARRLALAYTTGLGTQDMPIIASVAVTLANFANDQGDGPAAAEILGAAAQLRGADDLTDTFVRDLTATLRASLGADFDDHYQRGKNLDREQALARVDPDSLDSVRCAGDTPEVPAARTPQAGQPSTPASTPDAR